MRLITRTFYINEANCIQLVFCQLGILVELMSVDPNRLSTTSTGAVKIGLMVVLDIQFNNACELLKNSNYIPKYSLTEKEIAKLELDAKNIKMGIQGISIKWFKKVFTRLLAFGLTGFFFYVLIGLL